MTIVGFFGVIFVSTTTSVRGRIVFGLANPTKLLVQGADLRQVTAKFFFVDFANVGQGDWWDITGRWGFVIARGRCRRVRLKTGSNDWWLQES